MDELTRHRTADAPPSAVWDVVTDHALYADVAPNLATVEVLGGEGTGHVRRCVDTDGNEWTESCSHWETATTERLDGATSDRGIESDYTNHERVALYG
ncbi:MAG TPA: SRPBCC family protein [Halobacteriales archaeon]|nr:SRPBCC family protein [Halobacteriales archaeon]